MIATIKKIDLLTLIMISIISLFLSYNYSNMIKFGFIIILFMIIVKKAKFSFFSLLTFILVFTLFQEFMLEEYGIATGMLVTGIEAKNYFHELYLCTNIFCIIEYFFMSTTKMIDNEKKFYLMKIDITDFWAMFFSILALVITILIFPSIPTFKSNLINRFNSGILPFSGFAGLVFLLIAITYDYGKKNKYIYYIDIFIVFWFFGHAERVEALGLLSYILLKYINQTANGLQNIFQFIKKYYKLIVISFIVISFLTWLGMTRTNVGNSKITLGGILTKIFVQSTASDVAYIFNCSVDLWKNDNLLNGSTYLSYLSRIAPFIGEFTSSEHAIQQYYYTVGGCPFFAETMMNFGIKGIFPIITMFFAVHAFILKKVTKFRAIFWIPIVIEIFRTAWYGWTGWFRLSIFIVPIIYVFITKFKIVTKIK